MADQGLHCLAWQSTSNAPEKVDPEIDVFHDAEVEQPKLEEEETETETETETGDSKVQPLEVEDEEEKFFILQSLQDKETEQDRVVALMDSSDYEDITDVFRDIEIETWKLKRRTLSVGIMSPLRRRSVS